jgi:hypothetical protein
MDTPGEQFDIAREQINEVVREDCRIDLSGLSFSLNLVPKPRMVSVRDDYVLSRSGRSGRGGKRREMDLTTPRRRRFADNVPRGVKTRERALRFLESAYPTPHYLVPPAFAAYALWACPLRRGQVSV